MPIRTIAVAVSGTPVSIPTAKYAIYLAKIMQAKLMVIYVVDLRSVKELLRSRVFVSVEAREYENELQEQGHVLLARIGRMAEAKGVGLESCLLSGEVHRQVVDKVRDTGADLLVMGKIRELESIKEIFYNEGELIFREAPCAVVVVQNLESAEALYKEI